jgi:uncharacterized protein (DUF169 family)
MDRVNWEFSKKFGKHWIKVKFYKKEPSLKEGKRVKGVRLCEAIKKAITYPILIDRDSITCPGAQYALGWKSDNDEEMLRSCADKNFVSIKNLKSMFDMSPRLEDPFEYIGLNTEGDPDMVVSFAAPGEVYKMVRLYNYYHGGDLDLSLSSMMSICGGVVVRSYREKKFSLSFGCEDSRKFAGLGHDTLVVGVPKDLFGVFTR